MSVEVSTTLLSAPHMSEFAKLRHAKVSWFLILTNSLKAPVGSSCPVSVL